MANNVNTIKARFKQVAISALAGWVFTYAVVTVIGTDANLEYVKDHAVQRWQQVGYQVVGYEGYQGGATWWRNYGGARVYYTLRREGSSATYSGYLQRWGDEIRVLDLRTIDNISLPVN